MRNKDEAVGDPRPLGRAGEDFLQDCHVDMTAAAWAGPGRAQLSSGHFGPCLGWSGGSRRVEMTGKHSTP